MKFELKRQILNTNYIKMEKRRRIRAPNYSEKESIHLCNILEKYKHIIENKKADGASLRQKQKAWRRVVEEYNSTTTSFHRTLASLQLNYKNIKRKAKKQYSAQKFAIPVDKEVLIENQSSYGDDWEKVSDAVGASQEDCIYTFEEMKTHAIKQENGGGPLRTKEEPLMEKVSSLVGPAMEGLYATYDGDSNLMEMASKREPPIEARNLPSTSTSGPPSPKETFFEPNLKRKPNPKLIVSKRKRTELPTVSTKFRALADEKMELVAMQKHLLSIQIKAEEERLKNLTLENAILTLKLRQEETRQASRDS